MDYLLQQKKYNERNTTRACHVASVLFNVEDHSLKQQRSKLEAVSFVCFQFSPLAPHSPDCSSLNTVTESSLNNQNRLRHSFGFSKQVRLFSFIIDLCHAFVLLCVFNKAGYYRSPVQIKHAPRLETFIFISGIKLFTLILLFLFLTVHPFFLLSFIHLICSQRTGRYSVQ